MELSKSKSSLYASLKSAKLRRRHGLFIAEGEKAVADLANAFHPEAIIVAPGRVSPVPDVPVYDAPEKSMRNISNLVTPPDVIGVFRLPSEDAKIPEINSDRLYLLLDGVQDPGNLGTIIRTAHWFGIFDIFASRYSADCFNPKVVQATMGSLGFVRVHYCNLAELLVNNPQMPAYGLLLDGKNIYDASLQKSGFIIMGNEGNGISEEIRQYVNSPLLIPPATSCHGESLNVAIATAITLALFQR